MFELDQLIAGYPGFATQAVSMAIEHGIVHFSGANGSGKTTLLRCIGGELRPLSGTVQVNGANPHKDYRAKSDIALASANPELPDFMTVEEAWRMTAAIRKCPDWNGEAVMRELSLQGSMRIGHGSTGQRQRTELLCALVGNPYVLLLDETLAHLDREGYQWLVDKMEQRRANSIVLLTHHGDLPITADHVVELKRK